MRSRWAAAVLVPLLALVTALVPGARADDATPVAMGSPATWKGGPFVTGLLMPGSRICPLGPQDPTCHHHAIAVDATGAGHLEIVVTAENGAQLDVVVFDAEKNRVANGISGENPEVLIMPAKTGRYTVSVGLWFSDRLVSPQGVGHFTATATLRAGAEPRAALGCAGSVPELTIPPDSRLTLPVLVLLDGISVERAQAIVERARTSYEDIDIDLVVNFDDTFAVPATGQGTDHQGQTRDRVDSGTMFTAARAHVGGTISDPYRAVVVMTDKDLNDNGSEYMGLAYCIGALGSNRYSFALGEAWADEWQAPLGLQRDLSAVIFSHELGHLANAPHANGECTLGVGTATAGDGSHVGHETCTLMNYVGPPGAGKLSTATLYFSHLNAAVVRRHVARHAAEGGSDG